jgi:hypothetical protein
MSMNQKTLLFLPLLDLQSWYATIFFIVKYSQSGLLASAKRYLQNKQGKIL